MKRLFTNTSSVPEKYRNVFRHLFFDIGWFGVLNGSTIAFLSIYATRLGATGTQIGLIGATPAIINLIFALPAGAWLGKRRLDRSIFWAALIHRLFYALLIPLPFLFLPATQVWLIIVVTLVMNIPGTAIGVGFTALFAGAVPPAWRGYVAGIRNAAFAVTQIATSLICGWILISLPRDQGYAIVFAIGFVGAMMSAFHLFFVHPIEEEQIITPSDEALDVVDDQPTVNGFSFSILKGRFGRIILLLFCFHLAQYLAIPVFPLYTVNIAKFSDQVLSLGSALFYVAVFIGSLQLNGLSKKLGNRVIMGCGVVILGLYPLLLSFTHDVLLYLVTSIVGGFAWSMCGGALYNYLLEFIPDNQRPAHMAWYNLVLNAAILLGSLGGPEIATVIGLPAALVLFGILRGLAGVAILRWG